MFIVVVKGTYLLKQVSREVCTPYVVSMRLEVPYAVVLIQLPRTLRFGLVFQ